MGRKLATAVGAVITLAIAPAAQAANITAPEPTTAGTPRVLTYAAVAGEINSPTFTREGANVVVRDPSATLVAATPCTAPDTHTVTCPDAPTRITQLSVALDDGNDSAVVNIADVTTSINGGVGNDTITGSDGGADSIDGANNEDTISGRGGDDTLVDGIDDNGSGLRHRHLRQPRRRCRQRRHRRARRRVGHLRRRPRRERQHGRH
jgi:hypothetical protein